VADGGGERVLVVDDDPPLRRMLERTLVAEGFQVSVAADGGGALVEAERTAPDVIVLDVALPVMDGLAVCRRLRGKGLPTPILMLTARDAVPDRVAGLEAGADDYLVKPFAVQELIARIRALTRRGTEPGSRLSYADLTLDLETRSATRGTVTIELTGRCSSCCCKRPDEWSPGSARSNRSGTARPSPTSSTAT
jgi:two-component system response regulator MprA